MDYRRTEPEMSDDFDEKYEGHLSEFIEFISNPEIAVSGSYKETWKFLPNFPITPYLFQQLEKVNSVRG